MRRSAVPIVLFVMIAITHCLGLGRRRAAGIGA